MITEVLPCEAEEALELLGEAREWLYRRARLSAAVGGLAAAISLFLALLGPATLALLGVFSAVALAGITVWLYRGNKGLGDDVNMFMEAVSAGTARLDDYCELPLITAVVAFKLKRTGRVAGEGPGRGQSGRLPGKGYKHSLP